MAIKAATPQETDIFVFGSGIPAYYSWWRNFEQMYYHAAQFNTPGDWCRKITAENPITGEDVEKEIFHSDIIRAAQMIIHPEFSAPRSTKVACWDMLFNAEECDMDASDADNVLQVAVYGEIAFC